MNVFLGMPNMTSPPIKSITNNVFLGMPNMTSARDKQSTLT